jgi:hypothetical protein
MFAEARPGYGSAIITDRPPFQTTEKNTGCMKGRFDFLPEDR